MSEPETVNHPKHYFLAIHGRAREAIDVVEELASEGVDLGFHLGQAFIYIWRAHKKNGTNDLDKAGWYIERWRLNASLACAKPLVRAANAMARAVVDLHEAMTVGALVDITERRTESWIEEILRSIFVAALNGTDAQPGQTFENKMLDRFSMRIDVPNFVADVAAFHHAGEQLVNEGPPAFPNSDVLELRARLIREESLEYLVAVARGDMVGAADGLIDLLYVVIGTMVSFGLPVPELWVEVQRSNMAKFEGGLRPREDGKILKPEGWTPPNIAGVLAAAGWDPSAQPQPTVELRVVTMGDDEITLSTRIPTGLTTAEVEKLAHALIYQHGWTPAIDHSIWLEDTCIDDVIAVNKHAPQLDAQQQADFKRLVLSTTAIKENPKTISFRAKETPRAAAIEASHGLKWIVDERARQLTKWSTANDDGHPAGLLALRAAELALEYTKASAPHTPRLTFDGGLYAPDGWNLINKHGKDSIRCLVIAGALIAAEIDRLTRTQPF